MKKEELSLQERARRVRKMVLKMLARAGSGHTAGPLGAADFWTALYFGKLINYRVDDPWWSGRDRVVVSAGHYAPVVYAVLAEAGFFNKEELGTLRVLGSRLQGHPNHIVGSEQCLPGIEVGSGSLGQGISQAVGMALAGRMDGEKWRVFCFMSDGEQDEGQVWEGYMLAAKEKLSNLIMVVDRNGIQVEGETEKVMPLEPFQEKLAGFNLRVVEVDGNDLFKIVEAVELAKTVLEKPTVIVLRTTPGKGVGFMENKLEWHSQVPKADQLQAALAELEKESLGKEEVNFKPFK